MPKLLNKYGYDSIADEYYDPRHITSRNFDATTKEYCDKHKLPVPDEGVFLEIGCGKGSAKKYFNVNLNKVVQTDFSLRMLKISPREKSMCAVQCNAEELPFCGSSFSAAFAFLYDPYNTERFYFELEKILKPNAIFIGTLPHFTWGSLLRSKLQINKDKTQFKKFVSVGDKNSVELDSFLTTDEETQQLLEKVNFKRIEMFDLCLPPHIKEISPHIRLPASALGVSPYELPIVKLIVAKK